jgi:hypothetical protein
MDLNINVVITNHLQSFQLDNRVPCGTLFFDIE